MAELRVTVSIEVDGNPVQGFPIIRTINVANSNSANQVQPSNGINYAEWEGSVGEPGSPISGGMVFFSATDQNWNLKVNNPIAVQVGGFVLLFGVSFGGNTATVTPPADAVLFNWPNQTTAQGVVGSN